MTPFDLVLIVCGAITALAVLGVVYRMVVGPTILDRAISSDSLVTLVVLGMALYTAQAGLPWAGPAMVALSGLAFIGTVTFARFVAREEPKQGYRPASLREPSTDTGQHEAIHSGPVAAHEEPLDGLAPGDQGRDPEVADTAEADAPSARPDTAVGPDPDAGPDPAEGPPAAAETDGGSEDEDGSEAGFGAQPGSRHFDDGFDARRPDDPTGGDR